MTTEVRSQKPEVRGPWSVVRGPCSEVRGPCLVPSCQAFTMIEIAISLAVIGFALVAILGVLPYGMSVQKQNREETIINQDATVFLNAIRNGARGMDDLANYVTAITNFQTHYSRLGSPTPPQPSIYWYTPTNSSFGPDFAITNGYRIVGLLSTPKYIPLASEAFLSNYVVAAVRSLSGPASDKFPQNNAALQDLAFNYRMISEVIAFGESYDSSAPTANWRPNPMAPNLQSNLHEVRLRFRWPPAAGNRAAQQLYRTIVGGSLQETNEPGFPRPNPSQPSPYDLYFFAPGTYVQARIP
jgi:type II secretory pathway pseudopilin PulG